MAYPPAYTSTTAAANTAVVQTFPAAALTKYVVEAITVSWTGTVPTSALVTVTDNGTVVLSEDTPLALNNPYSINIPEGNELRNAQPNTPLVITVAAGGTGAIAKLETVVTNLFST